MDACQYFVQAAWVAAVIYLALVHVVGSTRVGSGSVVVFAALPTISIGPSMRIIVKYLVERYRTDLDYLHALQLFSYRKGRESWD